MCFPLLHLPFSAAHLLCEHGRSAWGLCQLICSLLPQLQSFSRLEGEEIQVISRRSSVLPCDLVVVVITCCRVRPNMSNRIPSNVVSLVPLEICPSEVVSRRAFTLKLRSNHTVCIQQVCEACEEQCYHDRQG